MNDTTLIKPQGDHRNLICYRKAEVIYDLTYHFAYSAFERGNRTIDQMVQAARSGKQNIIEGNADIETSIEMGINLSILLKRASKSCWRIMRTTCVLMAMSSGVLTPTSLLRCANLAPSVATNTF